jgi:hypothetical protein
MRVDFYFQLSFYILDSQFCFDDSEKDYAVRCVLVNDSLRDENGTLGVIFFFFYLQVVILVILFYNACLFSKF